MATDAPAPYEYQPYPFDGTWDPDALPAARAPSRLCLSRLKKELDMMRRDPPPGIFLEQDGELVTRLHAVVVGPQGTPYEGGFFYFIVDAPDNYPVVPPKVKLITTDHGQTRFNPNLYANGKVCLSILGTWEGPSWTAGLLFHSVLLSIQSLMNERPITNEPGWESIDLPTSLAYNELIQHETLRVAVCGMLESPMASLPESLRQRMRGEFRKRLAGYRDLVRRNMNKQGAPFHDPYGSKVGAFNYVDISNRIERLAAQLG